MNWRLESRRNPHTGKCALQELSRSAISRHEAWVGGFEIVGALVGEDPAVNPGVADEHFQALLEIVIGDFTVLEILAFDKGHRVRQRPRIALTRDRAELICGGQTFFVRGHDGGKQFTSEFAPKVIQEIFRRTADAAVVVRCGEQDDIRVINAFAQRGIRRAFVRSVRIIKRERFAIEIEDVHRTAIGLQLLCDMLDNLARDGFLMQAAGDG